MFKDGLSVHTMIGDSFGIEKESEKIVTQVPGRVDRQSFVPLWAQVHKDVESRIHGGEFDTEFPTEMDLVEQYKVSRHTIRQALRELRQTGMIDSGRGRSPRVTRNSEVTQPQGALYSLFASVEAQGHRQTSTVRFLEAQANETAASMLGLPESAPLIFLERVRFANDVPLAMDRAWLPARLAAPLLEADFTETSLYHELDARCGIRLTSGRERIRAVLPTDKESELLQIDGETAVLGIERFGERNGQTIEWRQTVVRGDRFSLISDLKEPDRMIFSMSQTN